MKVIILAGGLGTRISEETENKPKPMVLIDDKPIIWHLMNIFSSQGLHEFVLNLGYRRDVIKRWLIDFHELDGDFRIDISNSKIEKLSVGKVNDWKVSAIETGLTTQTGGRISQCMRKHPGERVMVAYGDGLANVNLKKLLEYHESHGKLATVTAVRPPARFGHLNIENGVVENFGEKNQADAGWINGGFFVLEPEVANFVHDDLEPFEHGALPRLVAENQLNAYLHDGFWQPMDTLREKMDLAKFALEVPPPWLKPQL